MDNSQKFGDVRTGQRLLSKVRRVHLIEDQHKYKNQCVEITWDEDGADYKIKYVTSKEAEATMIVCKILYLKEKEKQKMRHKAKSLSRARGNTGAQGGGTSTSSNSPRKGSQY